VPVLARLRITLYLQCINNYYAWNILDHDLSPWSQFLVGKICLAELYQRTGSDSFVALGMCLTYVNLDITKMPVCYWISLWRVCVTSMETQFPMHTWLACSIVFANCCITGLNQFLFLMVVFLISRKRLW